MILKEQSDWVNFNLFENHVKHTIYNYITKNEYIVDYVYGVYVIKEDSIDEVLNNFILVVGFQRFLDVGLIQSLKGKTFLPPTHRFSINHVFKMMFSLGLFTSLCIHKKAAP